MDRRKFLGVMGLAGAAAAIPGSSGKAFGQTASIEESTVTTLPDGSISIVGTIQYNAALQGYVVQALLPEGVHGQYLITNPDDKLLARLARKGDVVTVQGYLPDGALLFVIQTIDGKAYR